MLRLEPIRSVRRCACSPPLRGAGKHQPPPPHINEIRSKAPPPPLIAEASCRHDFGAVIGRPDGTRVHAFTLTNSTAKSVRILKATNMKSCCGTIRWVGPTTLAPGESATLEATVRTGGATGPLSHYATVETDCPTAPALEFWTLANVLPRVKVAEVGETPPLFPSGKSRRRFEVHAYGTNTEPPAPLDSLSIRTTLQAGWDGPAVATKSEGGPTEQVRPFAVDLVGDGEPGSRSAVITLVSGNEELLRQSLSWEVASAIKATPSGLVVAASDGPSEKRILIRSNDDRPFVIQGVEASLSGIKAAAPDNTSSATHTLTIQAIPSPENAGKAGEITITTDHPKQPTIKVAVFVSGSLPTQAKVKP